MESLTNYQSCSSHCCVIHGCKYGYKNCPVTTGKVIQEYLCEECPPNFNPQLHYEIELSEEFFKEKFYNNEYNENNNTYIFNDPKEEIKVGAYVNFISMNTLQEKTGETAKVIIESVTKEENGLFNSFKIEFSY